MPLIRVRALEPFAYRGESYHAGQLIDLPPVDAIVLHRRHKVTMTRALAIDPPREVARYEKPPEAAAMPSPDFEMARDEPPRRRRGRPRKAQADDVQE